MDIPIHTILKTKQLLLRYPRLDDAAQIYSVVRSPQFPEQLPLKEMNSENEIKNWLKRLQEGWATGQAFSWIVEDLDSGKLLGQMTLSKTGGDNRWAMAFWIHPDHRGKGFAPEGAERLLAFGFEAVGAEQIWAGAGDWNKGSYRVMEKIGMIFRGVNPAGYYSKGEPLLTREYEISREGWKKIETFHLGKCNLRIGTQNEHDHPPFARRGNVGCPLCVKPIFLASLAAVPEQGGVAGDRAQSKGRHLPRSF